MIFTNDYYTHTEYHNIYLWGVEYLDYLLVGVAVDTQLWGEDRMTGPEAAGGRSWVEPHMEHHLALGKRKEQALQTKQVTVCVHYEYYHIHVHVYIGLDSLTNSNVHQHIKIIFLTNQ